MAAKRSSSRQAAKKRSTNAVAKKHTVGAANGREAQQQPPGCKKAFSPCSS